MFIKFSSCYLYCLSLKTKYQKTYAFQMSFIPWEYSDSLSIKVTENPDVVTVCHYSHKSTSDSFQTHSNEINEMCGFLRYIVLVFIFG